MTHFTYCGLTCVFFFFLLLIKNKGNVIRLLTMPLFWILFSYFYFFGTYKSLYLPIKYDLLLFFSFVLFLLFYSITKRKGVRQIDVFFDNLVDRRNVFGENVVKTKFLLFFFVIVVSYCIANLYVNSIIYGSLEAAVVRFYTSPLDDRFYSLLKRVFHFLLLSFWPIIFVIRYFCNVYKKKSKLLIISVWLLVLISIPAGSRMVAVMPLLLLIIADIITHVVYKVTILGRFWGYIIVLSLSLFIFLFITFVRMVKFEGVDDLTNRTEYFSYQGSLGTFAEEEDLMLRDMKLCFDTFGNRVDFLPISYTFNLFIYAPIPRAIMPDKPVSFGLIINAIKNGQNSFELDRIVYPGNIDWAAGIAGEGWANGGIAGIVFYSILLGMFSGISSRLYYRMIGLNNYVAVLFALLFFVLSFCFIRGSIFTGLIAYLILLFLFILFVKCFYRKRKKCYVEKSIYYCSNL